MLHIRSLWGASRLCLSPVRYFSATLPPNGRIRKVLAKAKTADPQQLKSFDLHTRNPNTKNTLIRKEKQIPPITRQHAAHLLSKLTGEEVDMQTLGPLTNDDLKYFKIADKRIMCVLLGTTPNQLLDSVIVDRTVKSFLNRDQVEKALMISKMAKDKGVVAMNRILEYFLEKGKVNDALQIYSSRKKWGVPPNNQTLTILFDGCSNVRDPKGNAGLTSTQAEKIKKILLGLKPAYKFEPNLIHVNSAFSAMLNCPDQTIGFELWENWNDKKEPFLNQFKPNGTTFTILLKALAYSRKDIWTMIQGEMILEKITKLPERLQDARLFEAFIFAYVRCERLDLVQRGLLSANKFFQIKVGKPNLKKQVKKVEEPLELPEIEPLKSKFIPTNSLIDILMRAYIKLGDSQQAFKIFKNFEQEYPNRVDQALIHRYFITLRDFNKSEAGEVSIQFYKTLVNQEYKTKVPIDGITRFMVFNSIYTQSLTMLNDKGRFAIGENAEKILKMSNDFYDLVGEKQMTSHELSGYLKAIRRLRLTKEQRIEVLSRIELVKAGFKDELAHAKDKREIRTYISKVLKVEKDLRDKQERKQFLEKLDKENIPASFVKKANENEAGNIHQNS